MTYRKDIEGLRGIAVIAVVLFHLGYLPNGYLGVDIFFVISGYLITGLLYNESKNDNFSILRFYERRIRRIIPLLLFITGISMILGLILMLPDDLENLSQSVVATNFSANNYLLWITYSDYWSIKSEFKPLLHTWSLGIEEQFYLLYPWLFLIFFRSKRIVLTSVILLITIVSLVLFLLADDQTSKFYLIQYRFFELAVGGLGILLNLENLKFSSLIYKVLASITLIGLLLVILFPFTLPNDISLISIVLLSIYTIVSGIRSKAPNILYNSILSNRGLVHIGKISYSLYMWHQVIFAFTKYSYIETIDWKTAILLIILMYLLSLFSYYFIEQPYRNRQNLSFKHLISLLSISFIIVTIIAFYTYSKGGIIRDFDALDIKLDDYNGKYNLFQKSDNIHKAFNEKVRTLDKDFDNSDKTKILVIGNSFGRDVVNILNNCDLKENIEIRYFDIDKLGKENSIKNRIDSSDIIFLSTYHYFDQKILDTLETAAGTIIDKDKIYVFGIKDFGHNNGIPYRKYHDIKDFNQYSLTLGKRIIDINENMKTTWGQKYIDILHEIKIGKNVRIFTPQGKFLSQDTDHLTPAGAQYLAKKLNYRLQEIILTIKKSKS